MDIRRIDLDEWTEHFPESGFEPFHLPSALKVIREHATGELQLYGGFKGERAVELLPVLVNDRAVGRTVLSPPPGMGIPRLGPIMMSASPKQRKREKVNERFVEGIVDQLALHSRGTLFRMVTSTSYPDPRPYRWSGLTVEPEFTYHLDVAGRTSDDVLGSFSRDLRKDIRKGQELDITVDTEGIDAAREIHASVANRYEEQGKTFALSWPFVRDIVEAFDDRARVYVARDPDGEFRNGMVFLYSNDAVYSWMGGTRDSYEGVSTKSLVQWKMLTGLIEAPHVESVTRYDLSGANTRRLCEYKSGYGGTLVPYYRVESQGASMEVAKRAYQLIKG